MVLVKAVLIMVAFLVAAAVLPQPHLWWDTDYILQITQQVLARWKNRVIGALICVPRRQAWELW